MHKIITKTFQDKKVRTVVIDNNIWFVAKDILEILLDNPKPDVSNATKDLDKDELTRFKIVSGGQVREMTIVSESGLYSLIMKSRKQVAKPFQKWVTREVLPSIRKTGSYSISPKSQTQISELNETLDFIEIFEKFSQIRQGKTDMELLQIDSFLKNSGKKSIWKF